MTIMLPDGRDGRCVMRWHDERGMAAGATKVLLLKLPAAAGAQACCHPSAAAAAVKRRRKSNVARFSVMSPPRRNTASPLQLLLAAVMLQPPLHDAAAAGLGVVAGCTVSLQKQLSSTRCAGKFGCFTNDTDWMWAGEGCRGAFLCNGHPEVPCGDGFGKKGCRGRGGLLPTITAKRLSCLEATPLPWFNKGRGLEGGS